MCCPQVLKQLLRVEEESDVESFGDRGYIEHSGVLDKTPITYDLIVKVRRGGTGPDGATEASWPCVRGTLLIHSIVADP